MKAPIKTKSKKRNIFKRIAAFILRKEIAYHVKLLHDLKVAIADDKKDELMMAIYEIEVLERGKEMKVNPNTKEEMTQADKDHAEKGWAEIPMNIYFE